MDVASLLREVRERRGWSQVDLAAASGSSRSALCDYEAGRKSPTVATLNRVLAAVGLQIRAELEPLLAALDERVEAVLAEPPPLSEEQVRGLTRAAAALAGVHPYVLDRGWGVEPERGEVELGWAFDGETSLRLHGLGFAASTVEVALAWEPVARTYFFRQRVRGTGGPPLSWFEASVPEAQQCLGALALGPFGMVRVRLVDQLPGTVRVEAAPGLVVPVLTLEAVERGRPDLADVLARLRERAARSLGS